MKKYLSILFFFNSIIIYPQSNIFDILKVINSEKKEVVVSVSKKQKYILNKDFFKDIKETKSIIQIYQLNSKKSFYSIVNLGIFNEYELYTIISNSIINIKSNVSIPNSFSYMLLYNRFSNNLILIDPKFSIGSVTKCYKKIRIKYSTDFLFDEIFLLDDSFFPKSSLVIIEERKGIFKNFISNYVSYENIYIKKTKIENDFKYDVIRLNSFENLINILNTKTTEFDYQKKCYNLECYPEITRSFGQ